jgi:hypothetical protein
MISVKTEPDSSIAAPDGLHTSTKRAPLACPRARQTTTSCRFWESRRNTMPPGARRSGSRVQLRVLCAAPQILNESLLAGSLRALYRPSRSQPAARSALAKSALASASSLRVRRAPPRASNSRARQSRILRLFCRMARALSNTWSMTRFTARSLFAAVASLYRLSA